MKASILVCLLMLKITQLHAMDWLISCVWCTPSLTNSPRALTAGETHEPWDLEGWACQRKFGALLRWLRQNPEVTTYSFDQTFASPDERYCLWIQVLYYYGSTEYKLTHEDWAELLTLLIRKKINVNACLQTYEGSQQSQCSPLIILLFQERHAFRYAFNSWDCLYRASNALKVLKREHVTFDTCQVTKVENPHGKCDVKSIFWYIDLKYQLAQDKECFIFDYAMLASIIEDLVALGVDTTFASSSVGSLGGFQNIMMVDTIEDSCINATFKEDFAHALRKKKEREERAWQSKLSDERLQLLCGVRFRHR